jgi:hypothetical protein
VKQLVVIAVVLACGPSAPPKAPTPAPPPTVEPALPSEPIGMPAGYVEMHAWKDLFLDERVALLLVDDPP